MAQLSAEEAVRLLVARDKDNEQSRWSRFETELAKRTSEVANKHNAEMQKLQVEKSELAARIKGLEENISSTLNNARQEERLASEKAFQQQIAGLTKQIAELEAARKLVEEQREAETAKIRVELESALNAEKAKTGDLDRQSKDHLQEMASLRERNRELEAEMSKAARIGKKEEMDFAEDARS